MSQVQKSSTAYATLALLVVAFIAAIIASNALLGGIRVDLTENDLYTLSPGTRSLLDNIEDPINLYFYFSDTQTTDVQFLRGYANRVREMLEEFVATSGGALTLRVIDPPPFSEEEDRAAQYGLRNLNQGAAGESLYFGLAATNSIGEEAVIDVFEPSKEASLEYDLARLIYSLAETERSVIGLISGAPMSGGFNPQTQQPSDPWVVLQQMRQLFDVRTLDTVSGGIDPDVDVLWIVHPSDLTEPDLYAIDQFVLNGGRAVVFVDPYAEIMAGSAQSPAAPAPSSSLDPLFEAWGIDFDTDSVVADDLYALSLSGGPGGRPVRHIGLLGLDGEAMNTRDVVTADLDTVNIGTPGHFTAADGATTRLEPLLVSSTDAALLESQRFHFLTDPAELLDGFTPSGERYTLAARVSGPVSTAFPDGAPAAEDAAGDPAEAPHVAASEDANLIVVGDVDLLSDRLWVQRQRSLFGQQMMTAFASNGDFVGNAIANLSGSTDLIGLQSRATFYRPFDRVEALRRQADARFRETERRLEAELAETEQRLAELQSARQDSGSLLMTPAQQSEIDRFQQEQLRIRSELRAVQRDLDSSIERLGTTLKIVNIAAMPIAVIVVALAVVLLRRRRRQPAS